MLRYPDALLTRESLATTVPAFAPTCRVVTPSDLKKFNSSSGSPLQLPNLLCASSLAALKEALNALNEGHGVIASLTHSAFRARVRGG